MNDKKYGRLYPERAVAPARALLKKLAHGDNDVLEAIANGEAEIAVVITEAYKALDDLGFPVDEPLFLLRGQDALAPEIVRAYTDEVKREGAFGGLNTSANFSAIRVMLEHADRMEAWTPRKLPD